MPEPLHITIRNQKGMHARPAGRVALALEGLEAEVLVERVDEGAQDDQVAGERVNARSVMGLLALGAAQGAELLLVAEGKDAEEALTRLRDLIDGGFGEDC